MTLILGSGVYSYVSLDNGVNTRSRADPRSSSPGLTTNAHFQESRLHFKIKKSYDFVNIPSEESQIKYRLNLKSNLYLLRCYLILISHRQLVFKSYNSNISFNRSIGTRRRDKMLKFYLEEVMYLFVMKDSLLPYQTTAKLLVFI